MKNKICFLLIFMLLFTLVGFEKLSQAQPLQDDFDVIVIGGEPEGVAAAISSARNGVKTLLIDHRDGLGGLFTYGYLNQLDLGYDKDNRLANQGIFAEWYNLMGRKGNFDIPLAKSTFLKMVQKEENITLLLNTHVQEVLKEGNSVIGVVLDTPDGAKTYYAKRFIDTTPEADFAVQSGASFFLGQEDMGVSNTRMAVTLVMLLKDVDWEKMKKAANNKVLGGANVYRNIAWGFANVPKVYKPVEKNTKVRGLNIGMQSDGIVTINALQIFDVDGTNPESINEGIERGKRETQNFVTFLRKELPGFENVTIAGYPTELYIRETRHIKAEYQLPITDVWENKDHWDSIGLGAYPVDVQATNVNGFGTVIMKPIQYAIPFRTLIPLEVENVLVASKAGGYTSLAAGSARTVPIGMTVAEAAGVASALSIEQNTSFRELSKDKTAVKELQARLKKQGALLYSFNLPYPYQGQWFYPAIKKLMPFGFIVGGYANDFKANEQMSEREFLKLLSGVVIRTNPEIYRSLNQNLDPWTISSTLTISGQKITRDKAADYYLQFFGFEHEGNAWSEAKKHKLIDPLMINALKSNRVLSKAEGYQMSAYVLDMLDQGRFGHTLILDRENAGYIDVYNGRTMVPTRFVSEQIGAEVNWNSQHQQITIELDDKEIIVTIGESVARVNNEVIPLDAKCTIYKGKSYVPLRFISEILGYEVNWNKEKSVVEVTTLEETLELEVRRK